MAFTKRHYEVIASVLHDTESDMRKAIKSDPGCFDAEGAISSYAARLQDEFACRLRRENGRFDNERFNRAANGGAK
jgi:hypothetical protein